MVEVTVDFQEGFFRDEVAVLANGVEVFRASGVSTRLQIGLARSVSLPLSGGGDTLYIVVPSRGLEREVHLDPNLPAFVGVSITEGGDLTCKVSKEPFGYL